MMQCIVVDDEPLIRELLEDNINRLPFLTLVRSCKSSAEALVTMKAAPIDLIFLDIQMPVMSGLQFLQSLEKVPLVILVTAYEKYALKGFELNVVDYLLKPFSFERFSKACERANELFILKNHAQEATAIPDHFFVHVEYELIKIVIADIDYVQGLKDYIKIYLKNTSRPVMTRLSMKALEGRLPAGVLVRTHKSFFVLRSKITAIKKDFVLLGDKKIPMSAHYREQVRKALA